MDLGDEKVVYSADISSTFGQETPAFM